MTYRRSVFGLTIVGWGRYKHYVHFRQSTFEFGSTSNLSLIRSGVGLWLYRDLGGGCTEFRTSFDYAVRWGALGTVVDRYAFRPLFQWLTEQSFKRLAKLYFPGAASDVRGRAGRHGRRFEKGELSFT